MIFANSVSLNCLTLDIKFQAEIQTKSTQNKFETLFFKLKFGFGKS